MLVSVNISISQPVWKGIIGEEHNQNVWDSICTVATAVRYGNVQTTKKMRELTVVVPLKVNKYARQRVVVER